MPLLTIDNASLAYGDQPLLDALNLQLDAGERVALVGRNGVGKSTLLHVLSGIHRLDDGQVWRQPGLRLSVVEQEPTLGDAQTAFEVVAQGVATEMAALTEYERLSADESQHDRLDELQTTLTRLNGWNVQHRIEASLLAVGISADQPTSSASGGQTKRMAIGRALVSDPDVMLLDEPTNHLDLNAINWLEELLIGFRGAVVFVTHDRWFLDRVATRIVELDRGRGLSFPGNFSAYQIRKAEQIEIERVVNAKFDKFLAQEEIWIRKGVEARRTRNEGRVLRLEQLRRDRGQRRDTLNRVNLNVDRGERSGQLVAELTNVSKTFTRGDNQRVIVKNLDLRLMRGDKLGLIGTNGAGKTTLIKLLLGQLTADSGTIKLGSKVEVAYFDQLREQLNDEATLAETISPGSDWVEQGGTRKHVMSYLGDFLFAPQRAQAKVGALSGGERNRLLLARLFAKPANVLVLDEPTNDLDIDTLELLELLLQEYKGTLILVSHDRLFLDNVVTSVLAAQGDGAWLETVGGFTDFQNYVAAKALSDAVTASSGPSKGEAITAKKTAQAPRAKLSYKEQRELGELPQKIAALEAEQLALQTQLADPGFYQTQSAVAAIAAERLSALDALLLQCLERWEALEAK
jgi:ABC transport system ATP-binding/permease protein